MGGVVREDVDIPEDGGNSRYHAFHILPKISPFETAKDTSLTAYNHVKTNCNLQ